jgi:hypothetical protein
MRQWVGLEHPAPLDVSSDGQLRKAPKPLGAFFYPRYGLAVSGKKLDDATIFRAVLIRSIANYLI